jgi:aldehyde dehydrogenase (NAD+)
MKPSEIAPHTSRAIKKLFDNYMDPKYFRCIEGGIDVAVTLNKQPLDLICFTGSTFVGKIIASVAAKNLTPCILELGGKCPAVIHPSADFANMADKIAYGKFTNQGQTCIAPDYCLVREEDLDRFLDMLKKSIKEIWGETSEGPKGLEQSGHVINEFHFNRISGLMKDHGGKIVYGGKTEKDKLWIQPTIILNPKDESQIMNEEIFGPVLPVKTYKNYDDVINFINDNPKPLATYFFGKHGHKDC